MNAPRRERRTGTRLTLHEEGGSGLVGTLVGVGALLLLVLLATHALVHLYTTSVVSAVAFDAARVVAGSDGQAAGAAAQAEAQARSLLGAQSERTQFHWRSLGPDVVVLRVTARSPALLPETVARLTGLRAIDRTVRVRAERFR
ncbi:MAG: hypothetical protein ACR2MA_04015 [Egibacteraceae bacterium]